MDVKAGDVTVVGAFSSVSLLISQAGVVLNGDETVSA